MNDLFDSYLRGQILDETSALMAGLGLSCPGSDLRARDGRMGPFSAQTSRPCSSSRTGNGAGRAALAAVGLIVLLHVIAGATLALAPVVLEHGQAACQHQTLDLHRIAANLADSLDAPACSGATVGSPNSLEARRGVYRQSEVIPPSEERGFEVAIGRVFRDAPGAKATLSSPECTDTTGVQIDVS